LNALRSAEQSGEDARQHGWQNHQLQNRKPDGGADRPAARTGMLKRKHPPHESRSSSIAQCAAISAEMLPALIGVGVAPPNAVQTQKAPFFGPRSLKEPAAGPAPGQPEAEHTTTRLPSPQVTGRTVRPFLVTTHHRHGLYVHTLLPFDRSTSSSS
jgi:hypothetical protein